MCALYLQISHIFLSVLISVPTTLMLLPGSESEISAEGTH